MNDAARLQHFEGLYAASDDPWNVRGAWYEQRKRAVLLASLARPRYRAVFEAGCGNGEMSAALAPRCDALLACDGAASAVAAARRRLPDAQHVRFEQRLLPQDWPMASAFDLVVVSELAYYFDEATLAALLQRAAASLAACGELLLCHYLHDFDDRVTATPKVHALADALPGMHPIVRHHDRDFLLASWRKADGVESS